MRLGLRRDGLVALGFWMLLQLALALPATAQTTDAAPAGYDALIDQAVAEFAASHWAEARALFLQAHALYPNARTLRGIGMSSYELRDYPEAVRTLEEALTSTVRPLTSEQRAQVTELRQRAGAFVGRYEIPAAPEGARLYLDGTHVALEEGWPAAPGHVLLGVGEHQLAIRLDDGRAASARVVVRGATEAVLDIDLAPLSPPAPSAASATASATPPAPPSSYHEVPPPPPGTDVTPWVVLGVGAGVAVVGAILLGVGLADESRVESAALGTPWSSLSGAYERAPIETGVGIAALAAGGAAALVGLFWGVAASGSTSAREEPLVVELGPAGLRVRGSF